MTVSNYLYNKLNGIVLSAFLSSYSDWNYDMNSNLDVFVTDCTKQL